jgi:hypothetical protein
MKKKLIIIVGIIVVAAIVGFLALKKSDNALVTAKQDPVTGLSIYTNTDWGFSVAYSSSSWQGPAEKLDPKVNLEDPNINIAFASASTSEAIVIVGKPGDMQSVNDFATLLEGTQYAVVTVGGVPALRFEYVAPINEEASAYAKTVMYVFKGLKNGSVTIAYQKVATTEKQAKAANIAHLADFVTGITFTQ